MWHSCTKCTKCSQVFKVLNFSYLKSHPSPACNTSALVHGKMHAFVCLEIEDDIDSFVFCLVEYSLWFLPNFFLYVETHFRPGQRQKLDNFFLFLPAVWIESHFLKILTFVIIVTLYLAIMTYYHKVITFSPHRYNLLSEVESNTVTFCPRFLPTNLTSLMRISVWLEADIFCIEILSRTFTLVLLSRCMRSDFFPPMWRTNWN